jgi:FKBP-type peptidyl-prolyl cis-trans isomerase
MFRTTLAGLGAALILTATPAIAAKPVRAPKAPKPPVGKVVLPPLSYTIVTSGPADGAHPKRADTVVVNYTLTLLDGKVVDSSRARGEPASFPLNRLIPAWQVLIQLMRPGDRWMLYVPSEYAYGSIARDELPANSFLTFDVELVSIAPPAATN